MTTVQKLLVEQYVPLAKKLAYQKKKVLPRFIDVEDLRSAAYMGLVEAASRYDNTLGVAFSTYAYPRISGAIHDYLRQQGYVKDGCYSTVRSLDAMISDDASLVDMIASKEDTSAEECFDSMTVDLDDKAKSVLRHYFIDECSMKEVGQKFGVSESRISQLISEYKSHIQSRWHGSSVYYEMAA